MALTALLAATLLSISSSSDDEIIKATEKPVPTLEERFDALNAQIMDLQRTVSYQQQTINDLNDTLQSFVFTADEYGVIYDKMDDEPLLLTSAHSHNVSFVMLNVISVRLPKRDSVLQKSKRRGGRASSKRQSRKKQAKSRYVHVIVTLNGNGIYQLWDEDQNELYSYNASDDDLSLSLSSSIVYSDILTQTKYGNTWFVMAQNDASFVKVYTVNAWRDYTNDQNHKNIVKKSIISGKIALENTIYRPTNKELLQIKAENDAKKKRQKKPYGMSASKRTKMKKNQNDFEDEDVDEQQQEQQQCDADNAECAEPKQESAENELESTEESRIEIHEIPIKNATVTGVTVYQQHKKQYLAVSYSDGKIFSFKPNGDLSSSAASIPFQSPNKSIVAMSRTSKKNELLIITEAGFRFLKLPKLSKHGPFCPLPPDTLIVSIAFDYTLSTLMYLGSSDGRIMVYNAKKLNKKLCKQLDSFYIEKGSRLQIETIPGYLLITSSIGLHVYNVSTKDRVSYQRPGLVFVRRFEDEFDGANDDNMKNDGANVLISSYTDLKKKTVIAYAQSGLHDNGDNDKDIGHKFVVLESYLPYVDSGKDRGGIVGALSKAPIFVAVAMFAFFYVFVIQGKGRKGAGSGGLLGRMGKLFGGGRRRHGGMMNRRGRGGDPYGKRERWGAKHGGMMPGSSSSMKQSANMRYGSAQGQRGSKRGYGNRRQFGGFGGADFSD